MGILLEKIKYIDDLLKKRDEEYPARGPLWHELEKECEYFFNLLLNELNLDWTPDHSKVEEINKFIKSPIFICGPGRSGTTLLAQLLDGHPDLYVMPGDSTYMSRFYNQKWKFNSLALYWIKRLINPLGQKPFWFFGKSPEKYKQFLLHLKYFLGQKREPFLAVVSSMYATDYNKNNKIKHWVEKTPGNEEYVEVILENFPSAKFIHIIRDPLENLFSQKKFSSLRNAKFNVNDGAFRIKSLLNLGWKNLDTFEHERYLILRYEDLVSRLPDSLDMICHFLDINFSESLFIPTVNTIPSSSNSVDKERQKIGKVIKQGGEPRWVKYFTEEEKKNIVSILYETALKSGYPEWKEEKIKKYRDINYKKPSKFSVLNIFKNIYSNILLIASILASLAGILFFIVLFLPDFNIFWLILSPIIIAFYQVPAVYLLWLWRKKKNKIE